MNAREQHMTLAPTLSSIPVQNSLLQRKCVCGQHKSGTGECVNCHMMRLSEQLQTKLQIGEANDRYEKEADYVAEQVMRMPKPKNNDAPEYLQAKPLVQRHGSHTQSGAAEVPSAVHEVLRSPGKPLDSATCAFIEPRFGYDFSPVRVHTDRKAAESAGQVNALAYTVGHDIVFGDGQYAPASISGRRLLLHELTHVLQQNTTGERTAMQGKFALRHTGNSVVSHTKLDPAPNTTLQRTCADGRCEDCAGGRRDFWVTAFFRRRATRRTMDHLRQQINGAKTILNNCCINLKFDFNWTLLRGSSTLPAPTARPAGDPLGPLDYPTDAETLGEGVTFSGARGVPMLVVDDVPGSGGGVTMLPGLDAEYTGRNYFAIAVNQPAPNPNCNHIAHELWHMTGAARHNPAEGAITACTSNAVSLTYCNALRHMVAPRGDFPSPSRGTGATRMA